MTQPYYDQLNDAERDYLDMQYTELHEALKLNNMTIDGGDTAERVVDAIAKGIIETRANRAGQDYLKQSGRLDGKEFLQQQLNIPFYESTPNGGGRAAYDAMVQAGQVAEPISGLLPCPALAQPKETEYRRNGRRY